MEYRNIVVQAVHIAPGEEFLDLSSYVDALASIRTVKQKYRPFENLVVGRPAFGALVSDRYSYRQDVMIMAQALEVDADMALNEQAALVYLGHGNDTISTSGYYLELEARMTDLYPELQVCFGSLAGFPSQQEVLQQLKRAGVRKVLLKPFMLVAGMHAVKDMVGREKFSWKTMFEEQGMEVLPVLAGLGEQNAVARIFISHIEDAAKDAGIAL
jgi:sirohydrochlorin cobaltochelatase